MRGRQVFSTGTLRNLLTLLVAIAMFPAGRSAASPTLEPWVGTWNLNLEKSTLNAGPPAFKRAICTIEPWQDGGLKVIYDIVGIRGGVTHTEWTGRFDGRDYAVQGVDAVLTNAYSLVDGRNYNVTSKIEGKIEAAAKVTVAPDGRTLTTITTRKNPQGEELRTTMVFEKR